MFIRREFLLVGIIAFLALPAAEAQTRQWKTYDGTRYGFTVLFPHLPKVSTQKVDSLTDKDIPVTDFEAANNIERYYVSVALAHPTSGPRNKFFKDWLDSYRQELIAEGSHISDDNPMNYGNVLGREIIHSNGEKVVVSRWFLTLHCVYLVEAEVSRTAVLKNPAYADYMSAFVDSFKTVDN